MLSAASGAGEVFGIQDNKVFFTGSSVERHKYGRGIPNVAAHLWGKPPLWLHAELCD